MNHEVGHEELMRFLDDELPPDRHQAVAAHIERCTECRRDYLVFRELKGDLQTMATHLQPGPSMWHRVNRQLTRPLGWVLLVAGAVVLAAWAVWSYATSPELFWRKLVVGAIVVGAALLLLSAIVDRIIDLKTDPYRQIQR